MRRAEALALVVLVALMAAMAAMTAGGGAAAATSAGLYHAGLRALKEGDCAGARRQFDAFFAENPGYVDPPHPFYFDVLRAVDACGGKLSLRAIGQDAGELPPLPEEPPPVQ